MKAFLTTKLGDMGLLLAIIILANTFGTLNINELLTNKNLIFNSGSLNIVAFCFLFAAMAKSAQVPLHIWLPDAMVGPTPVSALIHAATMVTAGIYLIARSYIIFELTPEILFLMLIVGLITTIYGSLCALFQDDLKKVLAYSTISQLGLMFVALGLKAYNAAIFHLLTHAFFKALLFLSVASIGYVTHHQYSMKKLGGVFHLMPTSAIAFMFGSFSLCGFPLISAGFFSKEWILSLALSKAFVFYTLVLGSLLSAAYISRAFFLTFLGKAKFHKRKVLGLSMYAPLFILGLLSSFFGLLHTPSLFGDVTLFDKIISSTIKTEKLLNLSHNEELIIFFISIISLILGILFGLLLYKWEVIDHKLGIKPFFKEGFFIDNCFEALFTKPCFSLANILSFDIFLFLSDFIVKIIRKINHFLSLLQSGFLTHYIFFFVGSLVFLLSLMVLR